MPGNQGGSNWGTTAANPDKGLVYVLNMEAVAILRLEDVKTKIGGFQSAGNPAVAGAAVFENHCAACHGAKMQNPIAGMPTWLQPFAEWNPTSTLSSSLRQIWGNPNPYATGSSLASTEPILVTLIWVVVILAVFAPLGVRRYRSMSR